MTYCECDRCDTFVAIESPKGILGYKIASYPEDWKQVESDVLCPKCAKEWYDAYSAFMHKGRSTGSRKTKR